MAAKSMALAKLLEKRMMFQDFLSQRHDAHANPDVAPGQSEVLRCQARWG